MYRLTVDKFIETSEIRMLIRKSVTKSIGVMATIGHKLLSISDFNLSIDWIHNREWRTVMSSRFRAFIV